MASRRRGESSVPFDEACAIVSTAMAERTRVIDEACSARPLGRALRDLEDRMRANAFPSSSDRSLDFVVRGYDGLTRREGFHVLHDWDGKAGRVNDDIIPVDVLRFVLEKREHDEPDTATLAILLDYYFLNILALLSLRVWDDDDAGRNLDRLDDLLRSLQGDGGSAERFCDSAATLILVATCHYEPVESGYDTLLRRVRQLGIEQRIRIAVDHAASMGSHLRFGYEATYARDTQSMREDNVADYPWLCFALATLIEEYDRRRDHGDEPSDRIVEALGNGLLADPAAFVGSPPPSLASSAEDSQRFQELFNRHRVDLTAEFERFRPSEQGFSPFAFFFNFSHNVIKGTIVDALLWGEPWRVSFNDLLTGLDAASDGEERRRLASTLMGYARTHPDRIRGRLMPVIVYDPVAGRQAFGAGLRRLKELAVL